MVSRTNPSSNRPVWVPDSSATACARCRANFSFELRRHHCRFCGKVFCHYCSSKSRPVLALGYLEPVRVCDVCYELCSLRDAFLEVVRSGDLRATQVMLQHQHVGADDSTGTQTPLLVAASKGAFAHASFLLLTATKALSLLLRGDEHSICFYGLMGAGNLSDYTA